MKAYIAISFRGRNQLNDELNAITASLEKCGVTPFVFVDHYSFSGADEKPMMELAMEEIDQADLLIAAASEKATGIGIEAGYAKGRGKPVLYIRHSDAEHSTTLSGISDYRIIYNDLHDLAQKLVSILKH